jgi:hypothetical protein
LITLLRADRAAAPAALSVIRATEIRELRVTIGERPLRDESGARRS